MSTSKIHDEFTKLKVSRQRKWQLRRIKDGLCGICGGKAVQTGYCSFHASKQALVTRGRYRTKHKTKGYGGWKYPEQIKKVKP